MKASWVSSVAVFLAVTLTAAAQFETQLQRINRENNARQWANARADMQRQIDEFNVEIAAARAKYWATYPDKPGAPEAAKRFYGLLLDKDQFYITSVLSMRMSTGGDPGDSLDDGIRSTAQPEFDDFIKAARPGVPTLGGDIMQMMQATWTATDHHPDEFNAYRMERNWWEFDQVHRIPAQWDTAERYPIYLYVRYFKLQLPAAEASVAAMIKLMGRDVVTAAAEKVRTAPKTAKGNMVVTVPRPVKIGPGGSEVEDYSIPQPANVVGAYSSPLSTFSRLISQDDDRRYLLYLLSNEHVIDSTRIDRVTQWQWAEASYGRLVAAFSEKEVLAAAHKVRTAQKAYNEGRVMDPKAIGSTRADPFSAFEDILARQNLRGYVRVALAFNRSLDSAAAIDAAYQSVVASQEEAYLNAARRRSKDRPNVTSAYEIQSMEKLLSAGPEVEKAPEPMVDFPAYLDWKRFPAGATITYVERKWMASRPRPGNYNSDDPTRMVAYPPESRNSYKLQSINDQKAELWFTQASANVYGQMHPASDSEIGVPAKYLKSTADLNAKRSAAANNGPLPKSTLVWNAVRTSDPVESGDEIVEIKGQRIPTHWESANYTGPDFNNEVGVTLVVKVWTSDAIPTGLVRRTEDKVVQHIPGQLVPARYIVETYLESFDGFTPPTPTGSGPVMTSYTPPPSAAANPVPAATHAANSPSPVPSPFTPPAKPTPNAFQPGPRPQPPSPPTPTMDTSKMPPEMARQVEATQKYTNATTRASRARSQLMQWQQLHGASAVPADVAAARDHIPAQLQAVALSVMRSPGGPDAIQALQTLDTASTVIENFLGTIQPANAGPGR